MNSTVKFLASLTISTFTAASGAVAWASSAPKAKTNSEGDRPAMEVRVYDYAHLERKVLMAAENEADRIFSNAGVEVRWIDCPTSHDVVADFPSCTLPASTVSNTLILLAGPATTGTRADYLLGETQGPLRATVFYGRIEKLAGGNVAPTAIVMGRVIAHLTGRNLLDGASYVKTGILQDFWSDEQLNPIAGDGVLFTHAQAQQMVGRIDAQNQALEASQSARNANGQ